MIYVQRAHVRVFFFFFSHLPGPGPAATSHLFVVPSVVLVGARSSVGIKIQKFRTLMVCLAGAGDDAVAAAAAAVRSHNDARLIWLAIYAKGGQRFSSSILSQFTDKNG